MKKKLLYVGLLGLTLTLQAQILTHVDDGAVFYVSEGSLVFNGGGLQTKGSGQVDIHGNVMVVGQSGTDLFRTVDNSLTPLTQAGNNIVLRLNDPANYNTTSTYGQLYISGLRQNDITGFVTKEYRATKNGSFQQMALPFYNKSLSSLASDLGFSGFSNQRNANAVFYYENQRPVMHNLLAAQNTGSKAAADIQSIVNNNAARYYAVGTLGWDPANPNNIAQAQSGGSFYAVKGVPFSDLNVAGTGPVSYSLTGAGYNGTNPIPYGVGTGNLNNNIYNEQYKSYLQDEFDLPSQGYFNATAGSENGTFGRNMYQFGNPFFMNIDLSTIGYNERASAGGANDDNSITSIQAVRYEAVGVYNNNTGSHATDYKYITYNADGTPAGDYKNALIKPMQGFVIKLRDNAATQTLTFNNIRRFAMATRLLDANGQAVNAYAPDAAKSTSGTQKQLKVIGLDANGNEVMRTYFVVGPTSVTGHNPAAKLQAAAFSEALNTREEIPGVGGEDTAASGKYLLYINEANQNDFQGKKVKMVTDAAKIKSYKFELAENAVDLPGGASQFADGGLSFYIEQTPGTYIKISQNQALGSVTTDAGLYYGQPNNIVLATTDNVISDKNDLIVAKDKEHANQQVIFPSSWKKATISVYDMAGRLVLTERNINAASAYILKLQANAGYLIEAVSEKGEKKSRKITN